MTVQRKIMAQKKRLPDVGAAKQRPLEHAKKKADQSGPAGKQPHEIAERANMKRQKKHMHQQDNK